MSNFSVVFSLGTLAIGALMMTNPALAQSTAPSGDLLFKQRCSLCHTVDKAKPNGLGPNLAGVVGRKGAMGSFAYSPALKKANIVWSKANLDRFLAAPAKVVPGTRMVIAITDARQRAAIIEHLSKAK